MGYQIIKQPDGRFALFSSYTETIIATNAAESDIIDFFGEQAAKHAREVATQDLNDVKADDPERAYAQFVMTWDQALAADREHGGETWRDFAT